MLAMSSNTSNLAGLVTALLFAAPAFGQTSVDANLPVYKSVNGISGNVKSVGSDTMNNLMTLWAEGFRKFYPNVDVAIEGKGSTTGPPALKEGTASFAPMSRAMKPAEIDAFKSKFGYAPTELPTSIDMLAVYVHKDNPIQGLTMKQVDAVFSRTRKGGSAKAITTWGDLGLTGEWANRPIALYGRNSASGTYGYFKEHALFNGDYKNEVKEMPGSSAVIQAVAGDKYGIGYSGIGYKTADVRVVPLKDSDDPKEPFVPAESEKAYSGEYPLARFLFVYVNREPNSQLDPLRREFVRYLFSREGQTEVVKSGYLPVMQEIAGKALQSIGVK
jgi:phosphate transport system substrate-binding protein